MSKLLITSLTKKSNFKLKEVEKLYKTIKKYDLRQQAYKNLLKVYIKFNRGR